MKFLTGNGLIILLILQYAAIATVFAWQKNWGKAIYFVGAVIISVGVLWME
jgi:uncharacterized membrane protein